MISTYKFRLSLITLSYLSLLVGFYFGEDTVGGMEQDYNLLQVYMITTGFKDGLNNFLFDYFPSSKLNHSPIYYIVIYYMQNIFGTTELIYNTSKKVKI